MAEQDEMTGPEHAAQVGQLTVVHTLTDGIRVVSLAGEIDHHTGDTLRSALDASGGPEPRIIVDLAQVTFMDSSGINIFITAHRTLGEAGGWLRLAAVGDAVMRTLHIVGVDAVIDCRETLHQALCD
ncbi:STAS domain-containing protein [Streptomyces griseofuscus]|uniref:STAS domain-containing protein n=1 Tax=Streptomyces TaxID=1883 RepID=UPI00081F58FB|nr:MULTISPECIES: STAS domain-containing protein [unclassified Streptomyces]SCF83004.1 stage II sporulation protein AA (anti-sigma F factor antagonist) [Streptomyces sp. DconLS]SCF92444.1 stage II sporulation protein AA (anti-sigma F factor antagonist) [Streptomyces sp. LamerLS-31b]